MMWKFILSTLTLLSLLSCAEGENHIVLGKKRYIIPSDYIVSYDAESKTSGFDDSSNMVALTFTHEEALSHLTGKNGWLPRSPISVIIYDEKVGSFEKTLSKTISVADLEIVEFQLLYRIFKKQSNSHWITIPKNGAVFDSNVVHAQNVLDCMAMGGIDGIKSSRVEINIPTSCKITVKKGNLVIRFSSTEENIVENFDLINDLVFSKLESWKLGANPEID